SSPYRMRFAVYVRTGEETYNAIDEVPEQLRLRALAVRAFDADAMMVGWELVDGHQLEGAIERLFADPLAAYLHVHYAAPGCYAHGWSAPEWVVGGPFGFGPRPLPIVSRHPITGSSGAPCPAPAQSCPPARKNYIIASQYLF